MDNFIYNCESKPILPVRMQFKLSKYIIFHSPEKSDQDKVMIFSTRLGKAILVTKYVTEKLFRSEFTDLPDKIITNLIYYEILVPIDEDEFSEIICQKSIYQKDRKLKLRSTLAGCNKTNEKPTNNHVFLTINSREDLYSFYTHCKDMQKISLELFLNNYISNLTDHLPFNFNSLINKMVFRIDKTNIYDYIVFNEELVRCNHYLKNSEFVYVIKDQINTDSLEKLIKLSNNYRLVFDFDFNFDAYKNLSNYSGVCFFEDAKASLPKNKSGSNKEDLFLQNILKGSYQSSFKSILYDDLCENELNKACESCNIFPLCGGSLGDNDEPNCPPVKGKIKEILEKRYKL
ncbi:hypothetical protein [Marivirga sp.]|uniref:hypothetical protein n=1 Tax=Marivirga sp. TaxID=2018662 RepID=UPI003DA7054A